MCLLTGLVVLSSFAWLINRSCDLVAAYHRPPPHMVAKAARGLHGPKPRPRVTEWKSRFHSWKFATACRLLVDPAEESLSTLYSRGEAKVINEQRELEFSQRLLMIWAVLGGLITIANEYAGWWGERLTVAHPEYAAEILLVSWCLVMVPLLFTGVMLLMRRRQMFYEIDALSDLRDALQKDIEAVTLSDPSLEATTATESATSLP